MLNITMENMPILNINLAFFFLSICFFSLSLDITLHQKSLECSGSLRGYLFYLISVFNHAVFIAGLIESVCVLDAAYIQNLI